ncbi:MAG: HAMP domain-containing histidine kinase [Oligoflexia bacterium]|nr:HAMP domain-containing histidine kinase [Oligoflexia bacterium]
MITELIVIGWVFMALLSVVVNSILILALVSASLALYLIYVAHRWANWTRQLGSLTDLDGLVSSNDMKNLGIIEAIRYRMNALSWENEMLRRRPLRIEHSPNGNANPLQNVAAELQAKFRCRLAVLVLQRSGQLELIFSEPVTPEVNMVLRRSLALHLSSPHLAAEVLNDYLDGPQRDLSIAGIGVRYGLIQSVLAPAGDLVLVWLGYSENNAPHKMQAEYLKRCVEELGAQIAMLEDVVGLRQRLSSAEKSDRQRQDFLSHISHDVRSPLNNVRSILSLFKIEGFGEDAPRLLDTALGNCELAGELLEDVLDYTRYREGGIVARPQTVELSELVAKVFSNFSAIAALRGLDYRLKRPDGLCIGSFDPTHLKRIVTNLIGNAIKYTESGYVLIELSKKSGGSWVVAVADSGRGLDPCLWHSFPALGGNHRSAEVTDSSGRVALFAQGCGLGLAVSRILSSANGAELDFENMPEGGARFCLEIAPGRTAGNLAAA